jgi:hypothetical protein
VHSVLELTRVRVLLQISTKLGKSVRLPLCWAMARVSWWGGELGAGGGAGREMRRSS